MLATAARLERRLLDIPRPTSKLLELRAFLADRGLVPGREANVWRIYEMASGRGVDNARIRRPRLPPEHVPTTSIERSPLAEGWRSALYPDPYRPA